MTEEDAIKEIEEILENRGFSIEKIPALNNAKRPDLAIRFGAELYLVEQKTKGDNPAERAAESEELQHSKIIERAKPLQPRSRLSGILEHALEQLEAHPDAVDGFKIVWMTTWGAWKGATSDSLFKGLYGSQHVFDVDDHGGEMQDCYYLGFSDFRRYSEIDAVIIVDGESMQILVNEFSPRYERFMQSKMVEVFEPGVHDPQKVVSAGDAYSLRDYEGDRRDQSECLAELARSINVRRMMVMPMNEFQVVSNVSNYLKTDQGGADQPATAPESKSGGEDNPNTESERRSQERVLHLDIAMGLNSPRISEEAFLLRSNMS